MPEKLVLCSNCNNYHCCNFRPVSSSSTAVNQKIRSTRTTLMNSRDTTTNNQYQLARPVSPLIEKIPTRVSSPKRVHFDRPASTSSNQSLNRNMYLRQKDKDVRTTVIKQQQGLQRGISPQRVINSMREERVASPPRIVQGSPVVMKSPIMKSKMMERVRNSPPRVISPRATSPQRVSQNHRPIISNVPMTVSTIPSVSSKIHSPTYKSSQGVSTTPVMKTFQTSSAQHSYSPPVQTVQSYVQPKQLLKSSVIPINTNPSPKNSSTNFPNPSIVAVSQTISKVQNSRSSQILKNSKISGYEESEYAKNSNYSNSNSKNHDCSYNDNRCLGFDFAGEEKEELKLDQTGHLRSSLKN